MPARVYAFTDDQGRHALHHAAHEKYFHDLQFISCGALHALTGPEPVQWPWQNPRQAEMLRLVHYHRILGEAAARPIKIIPASFESVFEEAAPIPQALQLHYGEIFNLLKRYGHLRQFSLSVRWDQNVIRHLAHTPLDKERRAMRDQILLLLQAHLRDLIILENSDHEVILHAVLLVEAKEEEKLATLLQSIDKESQNHLHIRFTGPLPACNFARVEIKLPNRVLVRRAQHDLGLGPAEQLSKVKEAYRRRVKALHPDTNGKKEQHELMVRLTRSYRYLSEVAAQQNRRAANDPAKQWLRCDARTLRQTPLLSIQRGFGRWDDALIRRG